jgi:2-methylaconitate cis-trans-isomerase PrpF
MDLQGRLLSMGTAHRSYMATGAICTGAAAVVKGTLVQAASCATMQEGEPTTIRVANPYGVMDVRVRWEVRGGETRILSATVGRTARRILEGYVYVPRARLGT